MYMYIVMPIKPCSQALFHVAFHLLHTGKDVVSIVGPSKSIYHDALLIINNIIKIQNLASMPNPPPNEYLVSTTIH